MKIGLEVPKASGKLKKCFWRQGWGSGKMEFWSFFLSADVRN